MTKNQNPPPPPAEATAAQQPHKQPYRDSLPTMTYEGAIAMAEAVLMRNGSDDACQVLMVEAVLSLAPTGDPDEDLTRQDCAAHLVRELLKRTFAFESFCDSIKEMLADPKKSRELYSALYDDARERDWLEVGIKPRKETAQ